ncbi:MAG: prolyl oligopeptidase family serine peptidase [Gammaproteobacteria bacterium]|nr:prolyl oligopeptidase family serine peptidase [Gammaproteobacteria bacterium]
MRLRDRFSLFCSLLSPGVVSLALAATEVEPYPLEYFALREVVSNVEVSPDGKHVAMLKILSREGDPVLYVHDTSNLDTDPLVVNADQMEIRSYGWVSDTDIVMVLRQKVRDKIDGQDEGIYRFKIALLDTKKKKFDDFDVGNPSVENVLPNERNKIIISMIPGTEDKLRIAEAFRPRAYYKLNLKTGAKELLIQGKLDLGQIEFDEDGDPWLARGFDLGKQEYVWYFREKGGKGWDEIFRLHEDKFESFTVYGKDDAVPGNVLVGYQNGNDIAGLWSYNTRTKTFDELLYRRSDVDITGVRMHSNNWTYPDRITAVAYSKDKPRFEYFDEVEGATYAQLEKLIPYSHYVRITSRSRDGKTMTVMNTGPRDPGTYYLYKDGVFKTLGSQQPLLDSEQLADMRYIEYEARDGRKIPGYLTIPNGEGPYPLIVLPHGGPYVRETVIYDEWSQMLANNGYLVLQPQYRGSEGYGLEHYLSAWKNGSEAGRKMQDDKDDGAMHLVKQGLADPDRMAMFGWSYGGYAALIAASRTPQLYRCVVAGAGVSDAIKQLNTIANERGFRGSGELAWNTTWRNAVSPVKEVEKVNVPILIVHGSVDQRVQPVQARLYVKQLDKYNKPHKMVWLDGADHFSDTLFYEHQIQLYESMIDFLANDCGMKPTLQASTGD